MPDPSSLRDSTQIVLPAEALDGLSDDLAERFAVTVFERDGTVRVIGSPVAIKEARQYLVRHGVALS